jgi:ABC-type glycerol-3-phosphate transport system substrate-binding protein
MRAWYGILLACLLVGLAACGATNTPSAVGLARPSQDASRVPANPLQGSPPTSFPTTLEPNSDAVPAPTATIAATWAPTSDPKLPVVLELWVPEEFATGAERGGDILERQVAEFEAAHPNIRLNYVLKTPYGKGGIVDWLTQLKELMPDRLPDAAVVDTRDLGSLEELGLLHSLQRDLPSGVYWDLFPPAQRMARRGGQWNNLPLVLETEHLIYDAERIAEPPVTWQGVLTDTTPFAFAADSTETFLFHYLQNGGSLDPQKHPSLDAGVMQAILDFLQRARANGNLNETTAVMKSAREVMPLVTSGQTDMAQVRARDFLVERSRLPNMVTASIPTRDGSANSLVSGWTFVILTDDPVKQNAAAEYLEWMIDPAHFGEWTTAARLVPAGMSAFAQAIEPGAYSDTMWLLLSRAMVAPGFLEQEPYAKAWHDAVTAVLNGQLAPDDAAFRAVKTITQ